MESLHITIRGIVQGVGFRPFISRLAVKLDVKGIVMNTADGVFIAAEGEGLDRFVSMIRSDAPAVSKIIDLDIAPGEYIGFTSFEIVESSGSGGFTLISPDISVCDDCLAELLSMGDRRYLYPFINCTNCGPRYSITTSVPYDRYNTTMRVFKMCAECGSEYDDPADRRFHAQPNACGKCGPRMELRISGSCLPVFEGVEAVVRAVSLLKDGAVIAVKGLGGFHLVCDAMDEEAVGRLRMKKRKSNKPFALMAADIGVIRKYCLVSEAEEALLLSRQRPIVLLDRSGGEFLPDAVAPRSRRLGFMLPYTPLHHLLFFHPMSEDGEVGVAHFDALIMTSGNRAEEPIVIDNEKAMISLSDVADAYLFHDRDIFMRVDDSVVSMNSGGNQGTEGHWRPGPSTSLSFIRRARGYVPAPVRLDHDGPDVLGCGADLKNTFTLTRGRFAITSQHIGDMEHFETLSFYEETLKNLKSVYKASPVALAYDLHPDYHSTKWALRQDGIKKFPVQHHHAHIASVIAEKGLSGKVIGIAFDGTGYGNDGTLWGGEFLLADALEFKRMGHLDPVPLPGGEAAIREPWKTAVAYVRKAAGEDVMNWLGPSGFIERYGPDRIEAVLKILDAKEVSPLSTGAGRLFDAVSALIGVCDRNTFEGEAAMALETLVSDTTGSYQADVISNEMVSIDFSMAILGILADLKRGEALHLIASKFHNTVAEAAARVAIMLSHTKNIRNVVLSGGVFQNVYLLFRMKEMLLGEGLNVYCNEILPCNDGGVSLGQAFIIREGLKTGFIKG